MNKFTAYIVDDESLARFTLKKKLAAYPEIDILGEASNITTALNEIPQKKPDILFLDIQLNEGTGFDLLNQLNFNCKVIFITAYDEYAIRAFEINAIDYLLKPISNKRLKQAINRIKNPKKNIESGNIVRLKYDDRYLVFTRDYINFIKISEIAFIKSSGDYTELKLTNGKIFLESKTMNQWELCLPENQFCRISRFYIVNFDYILKIEKTLSIPFLLYIVGESEPIRISKSYYQRIKSKYK